MDLSNMTLTQLAALFTEKKAEFDALVAKQNPTLADRDAAADLATLLKDIKAAERGLTSMGALAEMFADEPEAEPEEPVATESSPEQPVTEPDGQPAEEPVEEPAQEQAEAQPQAEAARTSAVETLAGSRPEVPTYRRTGGARIVATAGLEKLGVNPGDNISLMQTAEAVLARVDGFPTYDEGRARAVFESNGGVPDFHQVSTAAFGFDVPDELMIDPERMSPEQIEATIDRACDETTLPYGSLVAAGGWCAPSEQVYDLSQDATTDGMLSLPEVGIRRGGLKWPISPNFAAFYANPGFKQTEAQAISGTSKPCVQIDCPTFDEKRLSVEGVCIQVPILTNVGYPEYVKNFVDGTLVAHQHWMNAALIGELVTLAGSAIPVTGSTVGNFTTDFMAVLEMRAQRIREKYKLSFNASIEAVVPQWVLGAMRADISNRAAVAIPNGVADNILVGLFRDRKINPQFVYDWQELPQADVGGTSGVREDVAYPSTVNVLLYPAGAVFKGTSPVISLNTVYDAASLQVNLYTALFTEQGYLVGKRKFHVEQVTVPVSTNGKAGALSL